MRKLVFILMLSLSLCGCGNSNSKEEQTSSTVVSESNVNEEETGTNYSIYKNSVLDLVSQCKEVDNSNIVWNLFGDELSGAITVKELMQDKLWRGRMFSYPVDELLDNVGVVEGGAVSIYVDDDSCDGAIELISPSGTTSEFSVKDSYDKNYWLITIHGAGVLNEGIDKILGNPDARVNEDLLLNVMGKPDYITLGWGVDNRNSDTLFGEYVYGQVDDYFNQNLAVQWMYCVYEFDGYKFIIAVNESNFRGSGSDRKCRSNFFECYLVSNEAYDNCGHYDEIKNFTDSVKVWSKEDGYLFK